MPELLHGTALALYGQGILILGQPGTGKSSAALMLMREFGAMLVADDCVLVDAALNATAPPELAGKIEIRPAGVTACPYRRRVRISSIWQLDEAMRGLRLVPPAQEWRGLPLLLLPPQNAEFLCGFVRAGLLFAKGALE